MKLTTILVSAAASWAVASCGGEKAETAQRSAPDAEKPYAEPVTPPPAHVQAAAVPEAVDIQEKREALASAAPQSQAPRGKVDNMLGGKEHASAFGDVKQVAMANLAAADEEDADAPITGDAVKGKRLYARCQACHATVEGQQRVGPSLYGIVGRDAGTVEGFTRYSPANKNSDIVWDAEALDAYLENPRKFMPGTSMVFPGLPKAQDRADIIAYLETLTD